MAFVMRYAKNGLILKDEENNELVYQSSLDDSEIEQFAGFLNSIVEYYFNNGGRYSEKRIYITIAPGDKHPDSEKKCHWCNSEYKETNE